MDDAIDSEIKVFDPHQSKIDPNDPRLKLPRPRGRLLKKKPIIGVAIVIIGVMMFAFSVALIQPEKRKAENDNVDPAEASAMQQQVVVPDVIKNAPDNNDPINVPVPDDVPSIGEPLPGDLGAAMVPSSAQKPKPTSGTAVYYGSDPSSPDNQKIQLEMDRALTSGPFFSTGGDSMGDQNNAALKESKSESDDMNKIVDMYKKMTGGGGAGGNGFGDMDQEHKNRFLQQGAGRDNNYVKSDLQAPISPFEIKAGSIVPISLVTGINSDLPGEIIGQVRENVYDTVTGNHLLIPQGSRLMATYDSMISYGQERVLVCWNRIIRPDGTSISLECMPGQDLAGYAGFEDEVDHHWMRLIGGVLISSILSATATKSQGSSYSADDVELDKVFAANVGQNINDVGQQITQKNLSIQPTITIRPGFNVNVLVNKDMILPPYK